MEDVTVKNFTSESALEFVNTNGSTNNEEALFRLEHSSGKIINSKITNIHLCNKNNSCTNRNDINTVKLNTELIYLDDKSNFTIENTNFEDVYGVHGCSLFYSAQLTIKSSNFTNCHFKNGFIHIDVMNNGEVKDDQIAGQYTINNSNFKNITSEMGTIVNVIKISDETPLSCNFKNTEFENIEASKYGGIIYSISDLTPKYINFNNCKFTNVDAQLGPVVFSLNNKSEPVISNMSTLKKKNLVATNPTYLEFLPNVSTSYNILSGEKIPTGIKCNIYDDYNHTISLASDISTAEFDKFSFFEVKINDTYNAALVGQTQSYCWGDICEYPSIKVIGNPGVYSVKLELNSFGDFTRFPKNYIDIEININECSNSSYLYQDIENIKLKSCYLPYCEKKCQNGGECINNNVCDCSKSNFIGSYCTEHGKMQRNKNLDKTVLGTSLFLIVVIIITMITTILLRENPAIKGGGIEFLIIILFGLIINNTYTLYLTVDRTLAKCHIIYFLNNMGFSLVFGSVLVKALRIYRIFSYKRSIRSGMKKKYMYSIIISFVVFHLLIESLWNLKKDIKVVDALSTDYKVYQKCQYPKSKVISTLANFGILLVGCMLSYSIRNVKDEFKENLVIPVYIYVLFMVITETINFQDNISLQIQDLFSAIETLANTLVILYFLYFSKFYNIYVHNIIIKERRLSRPPSQKCNDSDKKLNKLNQQNQQNIINSSSLDNVGIITRNNSSTDDMIDRFGSSLKPNKFGSSGDNTNIFKYNESKFLRK
ncbi:hypothetical protein BCR32DRAFT_242932 [Anaeromyces robustus]|uniref:G-protein coupled receptors family 3 profile domain-containing protein n=1 Tax=Anaeromyces robustus TaxID=1754192 RepID=A0A1Y1XE91_9FUNG|nr:hypothetical protein BCR32DRAFT_242932 [Anaeromyces robustus]|eukprot:ORX84045.1 hypothetical protein BCR32DRAFT_242932 [Anaeromyces robustus]